MSHSKRIAVIGGGAAGFFGAIQAKEADPSAEVVLLEKTGKLLSKVRISGGGRCNVTHSCFDPAELVKNYPRGNKELRSVFNRFSPADTIAWFNKKGVLLKTEADGRMFPVTDNSETIVNALYETALKKGIQVLMQKNVEKILPQEGDGFLLSINGKDEYFDKVLIAAGGYTKPEHFQWLADLGHHIVPPVPSLFTFNIKDASLNRLAGVSVEKAVVKVEGTKLEETGPLLVTHWGLSGPAILKLSAWGARILHEMDYRFSIAVNWLPGTTQEELQGEFQKLKADLSKKQLATVSPFQLPSRLWQWILESSSIPAEKRWADLSKKDTNQLAERLLHCRLNVSGKSTFKEEFVTAGGLSLKDVDMKTMESRNCRGIYFAGEVLDIDGITGGFNFQAAWSTAFIAGTAMAAH